MKNTVSISFSKNQCYITQISQENLAISLTGVTSFYYEGDFINALQANAHLIQSLFSKSTRVILVLPLESALLKNIGVDAALTDEEIIRHIQSQSFILFGYAPEQLSFDYETQTVEENNRHIIVAASHQQNILAYQQCFNQLATSLDVIDVDAFSLLRLALLLINEKKFILLFHHNDRLFIIEAQNGSIQKCNMVDSSSLEAAAQLDSHLSTNHHIIVVAEDDKLIAQLEKLNFLYERLAITSLFESIIQNKSGTSNDLLYPFLISIGASL